MWYSTGQSGTQLASVALNWPLCTQLASVALNLPVWHSTGQCGTQLASVALNLPVWHLTDSTNTLVTHDSTNQRPSVAHVNVPAWHTTTCQCGTQQRASAALNQHLGFTVGQPSRNVTSHWQSHITNGVCPVFIGLTDQDDRICTYERQTTWRRLQSTSTLIGERRHERTVLISCISDVSCHLTQ